MNLMKIGFVVVMSASMMVFDVNAKQCAWSGNGQDDTWANDDNWNSAFAYGDTAVFSPSGDLSVSLNYGGTKRYMPAAMRFESGNTTLTDIGSSDVYMCGAADEIYVAPGATATFVFSHRFIGYSVGTFRKTGSGTLVFRCASGQSCEFDASWKHRPWMSLDAGEWRFEANGGTALFWSTNITVAAGTKMVFDGDCRMTADTDLTLAEGSELRITDADQCYVGRLFGSGSIIGEQGTKTSILALYAASSQSEPFTGIAEGNLNVSLHHITSPFVIQSADQFAKCMVRVPASDYSSKMQFKAGIGEFRIGMLDGYAIGTIYVQDENGDPITVRCGVCNDNGLSFAGPGNLFVTNVSGRISTAKISMTGWMGAADGGRLTLGTDTAGSFDLTKGGTSLKGLIAEKGGDLRLAPPSFSKVEIPVRGSGAVGSFGKGVDFSDLVLDEATELWMYNRMCLTDGDVNLYRLTGSGGASYISRFLGGRTYYKWSKGAKETETLLESRDGTETYGGHDCFSLSIEGGEFWWKGGNGLHHLYLRGGVFRPTSGCYRGLTANSIKNGPAHTVFDGGLAELYAKGSTGFDFFVFTGTYDNADYTKFYVSEKGGTIRAKKPNGQTGDFAFTIPNAVETYTNIVKSGTLTFTGWGDFKFGAPMTLNGPVAFRDGTAVITAGQLTGSTAPFGTGDLVLRSARVFCDARSGEGHGKTDIALASGSDSEIVYEGACEIAARHSNANTAAKAITANRIRRAGKGSALFFRDGVGDNSDLRRLGDDGRSTVKLVTPPESDPDSHLLVQPIFIGTAWGDWQAVYDSERGLIPYDLKYSTVSNLAECTASKLLTPPAGSKLTLAENQEVYAAGVRCWNWSGISTSDNAILHVGNGKDPATICLGVCSSLVGAYGCVDFGTSEGVIVVGNVTANEGGKEPADDWGTIINTHLTGSGGVSYVADPHLLRNQHVALYDSATYTGGTRISAVRVLPFNTQCFSSGDVYLFGGEAASGAVVFKKAGTWANAFHIAGHGYRDASNDVMARSKGCIEFKANAKMSGTVEIVEEAMINVSNGITGTISGVVSGDRLKLFQSEGNLKLTGSNTYTGGTEVAQSTLTVAKQNGLGTGELLLDGGTVVFENTSAITVANDLRGVGTLKVTGAAVNFTGDTNEVSDVTIDYAGVSVRLENYPTFATVKNSSANLTTLTFAAPGEYSIDADKFQGSNIMLILESGATIDLGGESITVYRFQGDKRAVNGKVVEANPRPGTMMLIR